MKKNSFAVLLACSMALCSSVAYSQQPASYPAKPVRIVVGYQAGGPTDMVARMLAGKLQTAMGQPFIVENKTGAGSNIASEYVASSPADAYTLLLAAAPITMNSFVYKQQKFDVQKSFVPISMVMSGPAILAVAPTLPAKNLQELIALAKKQPGNLTFGSTGSGGSQHMAGELLKQRAGIDIIHVPYKGASGALSDLIAGHVSMAFMTSVSAVPYLKAGTVRAIAVASSKRLPALPDVPTFSEAGLPGFESDSWNGLFAPAGTSPAIVNKLHAEVVKALASPEMRDKLESQGAVLVGNSPAEFRSYIKQEVAHWAQQFKTIKLD